jgi:glycosyltransferase involved in cell wall biosynthesis
VAFDHGAVPDVVGGAGILCPPGDLAGVADAVAALRADERRFGELSRRARESALTRFGSPEVRTIGDGLADFALERVR